MKGIFHNTIFKLIYKHPDLRGVKTKAQFMLYVNDSHRTTLVILMMMLIMVLVPSVRKCVCGKKEGRRHLGD